MPVDKVKGGWKVRSYVTRKMGKTLYKTKAKATAAAKVSKARSRRTRSTGSRRAKKSRWY